jgi:hypothetical protein
MKVRAPGEGITNRDLVADLLLKQQNGVTRACDAVMPDLSGLR